MRLLSRSKATSCIFMPDWMTIIMAAVTGFFSAKISSPFHRQYILIEKSSFSSTKHLFNTDNKFSVLSTRRGSEDEQS